MRREIRPQFPIRVHETVEGLAKQQQCLRVIPCSTLTMSKRVLFSFSFRSVSKQTKPGARNTLLRLAASSLEFFQTLPEVLVLGSPRDPFRKKDWSGFTSPPGLQLVHTLIRGSGGPVCWFLIRAGSRDLRETEREGRTHPLEILGTLLTLRERWFARRHRAAYRPGPLTTVTVGRRERWRTAADSHHLECWEDTTHLRRREKFERTRESGSSYSRRHTELVK